MIVRCQKCETNTYNPDDITREGLRTLVPGWCPECVYADYPRRQLLGPGHYVEYFAPDPSPYTLDSYRREQLFNHVAWEDKAGVIRVDYESMVDKPSPMERVHKLITDLYTHIPWDAIVNGPDQDNVIRGEN